MKYVKIIISALLCAAVLFSAAACVSGETGTTSPVPPATDETSGDVTETGEETTGAETKTAVTTAGETAAEETAEQTKANETTETETDSETTAETTVAETTAETTAAETTTEPVTTEKETTAPETTEKETTAPETTVKETTAAETKPPLEKTAKITDIKTWTLNDGVQNVIVIYCVTEPDALVYVCDYDGNVLVKERALDKYFYGRYVLPAGVASQTVYLYAKADGKALSTNSRGVVLKYGEPVGVNAMIGHNSRVYLNWYRDFYVGNAAIQGDAEAYMAGMKGFLHKQLDDIRQVTGKNTKIIVVVCTNPATIHHDMQFSEAEGGWGDYSRDTSITQFGRYMKDDDDIYILDLREILDQHKDRLLFMQADSHWTQLGAYYGYLRAAEKVKKDFPGTKIYDIDKDFTTAIVPSGGDLLTGGFMNVPGGVTAVTAAVSWKDEAMAAGPDAPTAYVMGDSYYGAYSMYLRLMFSEVYLNNPASNPPLYDYTLEDLQTKKPDYLFYIWTERNIDASLGMLTNINAANIR